MNWGHVLLGVGAACVLVGTIAESYHHRQFDRHMNRIENMTKQQAIREEVERFHNDRTVDVAIVAIQWLKPSGILLLTMGIVAVLY